MSDLAKRVVKMKKDIEQLKTSQLIGGDNYQRDSITIDFDFEIVRVNSYVSGSVEYIYYYYERNLGIYAFSYNNFKTWVEFKSPNTICDYRVEFKKNGSPVSPIYRTQSDPHAPLVAIVDKKPGSSEYDWIMGFGVGRALDYVGENKNLWPENKDEKIIIQPSGIYNGPYSSIQSDLEAVVGNTYQVKLTIYSTSPIVISRSKLLAY